MVYKARPRDLGTRKRARKIGARHECRRELLVELGDIPKHFGTKRLLRLGIELGGWPPSVS